MPATSKAAQQAAAIALHHPSRLYRRNRGLLKMKRSDLKHFAETKHKGLPKHKRKKRKHRSHAGLLTYNRHD